MNQRQIELKNNLESIKNKVESLTSDNVSIVAVSKYSAFDDIKLLYELGHRDFGENRIDDLEEKSALAKSHGLADIRWHFIGRIQSNKIKRIIRIPNLFLVHSVSKLKHLKILNKECESFGVMVSVLLQVNLSGEVQKDGFLSIDADVLKAALSFESLEVKGLMTMAENRSLCGDERVLESFKKCHKLFRDFFDDGTLSMGMSGDYDIAVRNGSNLIRVGSSIFK